jgi:hypothetical protein
MSTTSSAMSGPPRTGRARFRTILDAEAGADGFSIPEPLRGILRDMAFNEQWVKFAEILSCRTLRRYHSIITTEATAFDAGVDNQRSPGSSFEEELNRWAVPHCSFV